MFRWGHSSCGNKWGAHLHVVSMRVPTFINGKCITKYSTREKIKSTEIGQNLRVVF